MNDINKTKELTTAAIFTAISVVLALSLYFVPILQVLMPIVSIPIIIIGVKLDIKMQVLSVIALGLIIIIIDPIYAMQILLSTSILGIVQGYLISKKSSISKVLIYGACAHFLGQLAYFYIFNFILDINILEELKVMIEVTFKEVITVFESTDEFSKSEIKQSLATLVNTKDRMLLAIPSMLLIVSFVTSTITFIFAKVIFKRINLPMRMTKFKDFRIDSTGKLVIVCTFLIVTAVGIIDPNNQDGLVSNYITILMMVLQVNGIALLWYSSEKKPNKQLLRISSVLLFVFSPLAGGIIELIVKLGFAVVGLSDIFYDFRKKTTEKK